MELNPQTAKLMKQWADITTERFIDRYDKLKIGVWKFNDAGRLVAATGSLRNEILAGTTVGPDMVKFTHAYYGAFIDMGVGRGTKKSDVAFDRSARGTGAESSGRRPKKWYSPVIYRELNILSDLAANLLGHAGQAAIVENLPRKVEL